MKASEMTNEELAAQIEDYNTIDGCSCSKCEYMREAAARLRKQGEIIKMAHVETRIANNLLRRLKVAEDALEKITTGDFSHKDGDKPIVQVIIDIASNALFAIHEEGGTK